MSAIEEKFQINDRQLKEIPLSQLSVPISHPRKNQGKFKTLIDSLQKNGLLEPFIVCKSENGCSYDVIDGTLRLTAIYELGWPSVLCIILNTMSLRDIAHYSYEKNMERRNLSPIEIASHYKSMLENHDCSMRNLESMGYGSPGLISQKISLLRLCDPVKTMLDANDITASHGYLLVKVENVKHQEIIAKQIVKYGWNCKQLEIAIKKYLDEGRTNPKERITLPEGKIPGMYFNMSEQANESVHLIVTSLNEKDINSDENRAKIDAEGAEINRMMVPGGIMVINASNNYNYRGPNGNNKEARVQLVDHNLTKILRKHQFSLIDIIICVNSASSVERDTKIPHTQHRIGKKFEQLLVFRKKGERELSTEDIIQRSRISDAEWGQWTTGIWMIDEASAFTAEEMVRRLVRMYSYEGDVVLDPFIGSGTTVKVARELGRQAYGYEHEEQYKEVIMKKLVIEPAHEQHSMADFVKKSLELNIPADMDSFLEPSDESKSCKPGFICSEGFADSLFIYR